MNIRQLLLLIVLLICSCFFAFTLVAQPTSGLVAHFKFNGNTTNSGPANVSATFFNISGAASSGGAVNKAIRFNGATNSYVGITDNGNLDFTANFTVTMGFYSTGANGGVFDNNLNYGGYGAYYHTGLGGLRFNCGNVSVGGVAIGANVWTALAFVKNGNACTIYRDGAPVATATLSTFSSPYANAPVLGQLYDAGGTGNYLPSNGRMDELRFYNRALSAAEINMLYGYSLPLKMGEFTATRQRNKVQLSWETLSEQNTSHFIIERSTDGNLFSALAQVTAKGNSESRSIYQHLDAQPGAGTNFYRLKMVDLDGAFTYSRVIAIKSESESVALQLFPNPATDVLQLQIPATIKSKAIISIVDMTGKTIRSNTIQLTEGLNASSIPVRELAPATYQLIITYDNEKQVRAFIKQ
jgi:hypothetical protein